MSRSVIVKTWGIGDWGTGNLLFCCWQFAIEKAQGQVISWATYRELPEEVSCMDFMTQKQVVRPTGFCFHCPHIRNALGNRRCQLGKEKSHGG